MPDTAKTGKILRGCRAFWLSFNETDWTCLGKDTDDLSIELNPDTEQVKNVQGEVTFVNNGYTPSLSNDSYIARYEDSIYEPLQTIVDAVQVLNAAIGNKVDKIEGKGLSTNDFTTAEKNKLDGIATGAEVNVQSDWNISDSTSDAFIKNKPTIPTKTSQLTNDSGYKTTDNNTWKQNTKTSEGYVPAGNGHANQVWGTDANGKPMWKKETGKTPINNLLATVPGSPLDATQGKKLKDELTALNDNLGYKTKIIDGVPHWSPWGADTWSPFSNFLRKKLEILSAESLSPINGVKNSAQNAIDGDLKNHYLADNPTQAEIVFTLKQAASIREIHVIGANSTSGTLYFGNVIAYGSSDNIDFTQIASAVMCPLFYANLDLTGLGFTVIPVQNYEIYKYIKLIAYGNNCGFYEVEIVG